MRASRPQRAVWGYALAIAGVLLLTAVLGIVPEDWAPANLVILYVPLIALVALAAGRGASIIASVLAFLAYNFFFVPPLSTLAVEHPQDIVQLVILLSVALIVGTLVAQVRAQAAEAARRAERMTALYEASLETSAALAAEDILPRIARRARQLLEAQGTRVRLIGAEGRVIYEVTAGVKTSVRDEFFAPLLIDGAQIGELRIWMGARHHVPESEVRSLLTALATQAALTVERARLAQAETRAQVLQESERLKSTLLSSVSHDLRTPLTLIKASANNLLDEKVQWDRAATRSFLETIESEADRLNRLVRNLLEMSRLEAGALSKSREPASISDIVEVVLSRLQPVLREHSIRRRLEPNLPDVLADPVQIELVLTNLLENAAKYAGKGTEIDVGAAVKERAVSVWVTDRGPGIPVGDEQRVFEKFYRAEEAGRKPGSSGLGLAIAKGIVEAHGGHIEARNLPEGGACITFELPVPHDVKRWPGRALEVGVPARVTAQR